MIELLNYGDHVRRQGKLVRPQTGGTISVDFAAGAVDAVRAPWGDVFTAYFSTGIPDIEDYVAAPPALQRQVAIGRVIGPWTKMDSDPQSPAHGGAPKAERRGAGADQNARLGRGRRRTEASGGIEAGYSQEVFCMDPARSLTRLRLARRTSANGPLLARPAMDLRSERRLCDKVHVESVVQRGIAIGDEESRDAVRAPQTVSFTLRVCASGVQTDEHPSGNAGRIIPGRAAEEPPKGPFRPLSETAHPES